MFIFTHHLIRQKEALVWNGSERVQTFLHDKRRPSLSDGSESVNSRHSEQASCSAKQVKLISCKCFSPCFPTLLAELFRSPGVGRQRQAFSPSLVQGPGWNGEKFNLEKEGKERLPWAAPPPALSLLHPCLQGQSRGAKPKPDGLIGPKDNK